MKYVIILTKNAREDLDRMDGVMKKRIGKKLLYLKKDPKGLSKSLVNFDQGKFRYRVGDFRICFDIEGNKILVLRIRHRREVYK